MDKMRIFTKELNQEIREFETVSEFKDYKEFKNLTDDDFDRIIKGQGILNELRKENEQIRFEFANCFN